MHKYLKQYDEAILAINKSAETDPNISKTYRVRGDVYRALKKYDKAKADYETAITLQQDKKIKAAIYLDRSSTELDMLDYKSCLRDLNQATELDPTDGMYFWHLSILYGYKKKFPEAIIECNTALELYRSDSSSRASLFWLRASHKENSGDYQGAVEDRQAYLKYYPRSISGYYELGRIYKMKLKNIDLANANLSKAADLADKANDTTYLCYIAVVNGKKDEVFSKMLVHIEMNKNDAYQYKWELHNMACMYAIANNTLKAFEYLDRSLKAGFDDYPHLVNDRDLAPLMKLPQWKAILTKYKVPVPIQ